MRHLLDECPAPMFLATLGRRIRLQSVGDWRRESTPEGLHIGIHPQPSAGQVYVGAAPAFGRLDPDMLRGAAQLARTFGDGTLRFTPWQSLLLPNVRETAAVQVLDELGKLNLLTHAENPVAHLIACTGSKGCGKGLADTKHDARLLATLLPHAVDVHLSGCPRSCAAAHRAPATLLAVGPGHYDLYIRDAAVPGFGALHAQNLTIEAAATLLVARSRSPLDA